MTNFLYGASVQGIQSFIFETNKLKEIVGASELVEQICTDKFYEIANISENDNGIILSAAGNIKYIFDDETKCRDFVRIFPKSVMEFAPGITISQAVVEFEGEDYSKEIQTLEEKLKVQRNKPTMPTEIGFMGLERARRTGRVGIESRENEVRDSGTKAKLDAEENFKLFKKMAGFTPKAKEVAFDISEITKSGKNSWIAVIHADGNGLGKIIQNFGTEMVKQGIFQKFSKAIDDATQIAVKLAFDEVVKPLKTDKFRYPIRPILIGGDDLTVIIRADLALDFTTKFLRYFEEKSKKSFEDLKLKDYEKGLTACAGISYIKESYPLHYGLHLAEQLCTDAKKKVKETNENGSLKESHYNDMPKSALAFYKVQESFVEDLKILKERTLKTNSGLVYYKGPYLLSDIEHLNHKLEVIKAEANSGEKTKAVGKLRQIISETYKDNSTAIFMMERMKEVNNDFYKKLELDNELKAIKENGKSQLLDLINLHSFNYGNKEN